LHQKPEKSIEQILAEDGRYPPEAVRFVRDGLAHAINTCHPDAADDPNARRHVSGEQLCQSLRDLALERWGLMACSVLRRWNIHATRDFGEIVFLMVDNGWMQKEPDDKIDDFNSVYDFTEAFKDSFKIPPQL